MGQRETVPITEESIKALLKAGHECTGHTSRSDEEGTETADGEAESQLSEEDRIDLQGPILPEDQIIQVLRKASELVRRSGLILPSVSSVK